MSALSPAADLARGAPIRSVGDRPDWTSDGRDWPNRRWSRFETAAGRSWHVQHFGEGPDLLLLHGVAAATHSWRDLAPALAGHYRVCAIDLPGHGFSDPPASLDGYAPRTMARDIAALLAALRVEPELIVGHSAGATLGAALVLDGWATPRRLVSLNGVVTPQHAFSAALFPALARLASLPAVAQLFSRRADSAHVEQVIAGTGSSLDAVGLDLYRRLFARPAHVAAAFSMMARWGSDGVLARLHRLDCPLLLVNAEDDKAIPPATAEAAARRVRGAERVRLASGGHLLHEAEPQLAARLILEADLPATETPPP